MPAKNLGRLVILPALFALFYAILVSYGHAVDRWIPKWDTLAIICVMIILERAYTHTNTLFLKNQFSPGISCRAW